MMMKDYELFLVEWLTDERHLFLISCQDHCQRFLPWQISDTPQVVSDPAENLSRLFWIKFCITDKNYVTTPGIIGLK